MLWLVLSLHEYFHLTAILVQDIGPGQSSNYFDHLYVINCVSLQYGLVYKMISRLFGLSGLPALWSGPEWGQEWPIQRGPDPFYILLHLLQVPFTQCPFSPPPLSSSHLKRQYLTGSSSHQIRDITSYCHNAIFTRCS